MAERVQVFFGGRVQGVGFRYSVRRLAEGFDVTGFVRNLPDGRVELTAEGEKEELEAFLKAIESSHLAAFIRWRDVNWSEATGRFRDFSITF